MTTEPIRPKVESPSSPNQKPVIPPEFQSMAMHHMIREDGRPYSTIIREYDSVIRSGQTLSPEQVLHIVN